ncbi:Hypothetical predicted protein [Octopus vulgaris]|uniref:DUF4817 domain-containing protein n=1 Tax=Octopus vulgaris TaxID=6645 RepID=A0AA36B533_OCTVU|nr:Hypothetical predicted protein [Octopus vulgaris]
MARQLTLEQRCKIATWQEVFQSPTAVHRKFERVNSRHTAPTRSTIYVIHNKFLERSSVLDKPCSGRPATVNIDKTTELLKQTFAKSHPESEKTFMISPSGGLRWNLVSTKA